MPVTICSLSGEPVPADLPEGISVEDAKNRIEHMIGVQAEFMVIFDSARECDDTECLSSKQSLTLAITLEAAIQDLHLSEDDDPLHRRRSNALLFLYTNASPEDAAAVRNLATVAQSQGWIRPDSVAQDAARWQKGDGRAIIALATLLGHEDASVRDAAAQAMADCCDKDDELARRALIWRLASDSSNTRVAALKALEGLELKLDENTTRMVISRLDDRDSDVRVAAALALGSASGPDSRVDSFEPVAALLHDTSWSVREASVRAMVMMSHKGDKRANSTVSMGLKDRMYSVRLNTADALANIMGKQDSPAYKHIRQFITSGTPEVRTLVMETLMRANDPPPGGVQSAIDDLVVKLNDESADIRCAALMLLWFLAEKGDKRAIDMAVSRLHDEVRSMRLQAVEVIVSLATPGDFQAFRFLAPSLEDPDAFVRAEAIRGMGAIANKKDPRTLDLLIQLLHYSIGSPATQVAALQAVAETTEPDDPRALGTVERFVLHEDGPVSAAAAQTLARLRCSPSIVLSGRLFTPWTKLRKPEPKYLDENRLIQELGASEIGISSGVSTASS